jgi:hypothetical protein
LLVILSLINKIREGGNSREFGVLCDINLDSFKPMTFNKERNIFANGIMVGSSGIGALKLEMIFLKFC